MYMQNYFQNCILCHSNYKLDCNVVPQYVQLTSSVVSRCLRHIPQDINQTVDWNPPGGNGNNSLSLCDICTENMKNLSNLNWELEEIHRKITELANCITFYVRNERGKYGKGQSLPASVFSNSLDVNQTECMTLRKEINASTDNKEIIDDDFEFINSDPNDRSQSNDEDMAKSDTGNSTFELDNISSGNTPLIPTVQCIEQTKSKSNLQKLLDSTTGYECSTCHKKFSRYAVLQNHDCGKPTVECETCGCSFSSSGVLKLHIRSHTGEKPFKCETCGQSFSIKANLRTHIQGKHRTDETFQCEICGKKFGYEMALAKHKGHQHGGPARNKCDVCGKNFKLLKALKLHLITHSTGTTHPYKCDICDKVFALPIHLKKHKNRVHFGEEKDKCDICGKSVTKGRLKNHKMIHSGEKPFQCSHCGKNYRTSNEFKDHEWKHKNVAFPCDICGKSYKTPQLLRVHARYHGQNKVTCEVCGKSVIRSNFPAHQKSHQQSHNNEKRFECDICDQKFSRKDRLMIHVKQFCHICNIIIPRNATLDALARHQVEVHTVNTDLYPETLSDNNETMEETDKWPVLNRRKGNIKLGQMNYKESSFYQDETQNSYDEDETKDFKFKVETKVEDEFSEIEDSDY